MYLVVTIAFSTYKRGDVISNSTTIAAILASSNAANVVEVSPSGVVVPTLPNFVTGYLALGTGTTTFAELTGAGYARQAITFGPIILGNTFNSTAAAFTAGGTWPAQTQIGVYDAVTGGNLLFWYVDSTPATLTNGQTIPNPIGSIDLVFPDLFAPAGSAATVFPIGGQIANLLPNAVPVKAGVNLSYSTGVLSVVSFAGAVSSVNTKTGNVTLASSDVGAAPNSLVPFKANNAMVGMVKGSASLPTPNATDTTSNSMNTRGFFQAPSTSAISDIVLGFPGCGYNTNQAEQNIPTGYTATASVEYPIGATPVQVFFGGAPSVTVTPGRVVMRSDPLPIYIPAGARYAVKTYVTWTPGTFWLTSWLSSTFIGEWTALGTNLTDNTLNNTVLTPTGSTQGFAPLVFAVPSTRTPVIGFLGDSITLGQQDQPEPIAQTFSWQRGLQGAVPSVNLSIGGNTMPLYLSRMEGRNLVLRNAVTHLVMSLGVNDIDGGTTLSAMQSNFQAIVGPFLARGVKVHAMTITPDTTSTDNFLTYANQTAVSASADTVRMGYNAWLRANWKALGLSGIFDAALAVDPTMIAKWACPDTGASLGVTAGQAAGIYATLTGGAVSAVGCQTNSVLQAGFQTCGSGYGASVVIPWTSYPQLGDPGSGASGTIAANGAGNILGATVISSAGTGYLQAPMINLAGPLTTGLHPTVRGYNEMIYRTGFGAAAFSL